MQNYWYKKLTSFHPYLYQYIKKWLKNPECLPDFLTTVTTHLLAKEKATTDPSSDHVFTNTSENSATLSQIL